MTIAKATFEKIVSAFEDASYEVRSYSGRGMYGAECLGVECDDPAGLMVELALSLLDSAGGADAAEVLEALRNPRTDSMGRSSIIYWPSVAWQAEGDDPEAVARFTQHERMADRCR